MKNTIKLGDNTIELGDRAKDHVTGFEGIVISETKFLNGCVRFSIQAEKLADKGEPVKEHWFDDTQLEIIEKRAYFGDEPVKPLASVGGPRDHQPRRPDTPSR
ncbi:hypothetical protein LCGC14_3130030 [marine sediment metagenome]|uniref:Uncharacterized protein n=1 Tax=marine sediment metagenome TaxID=412755 RepID=A0A0F8VZX7_9ZZZZ